MLKRNVAILLCLLCTLYNPLRAGDGKVVTYLGIEQGLSNNSVRCIYQDRKGFMWFGTYDGLNRWDGYEFKVFRNKYGDSTSLINNWVYTLSEGSDGELWVGTRQGLCLFDEFTEKFTPALYEDKDRQIKKITAIIKDIKTDAAGNMLVGTQGMGLFLFEKGGGRGRRIGLEDGSLNYEVPSMLVTGDDCWIFVQNKGLCRLDRRTYTLRLVNAALRSALCIVPLKGDIWIGSSQGIYQYNRMSDICALKWNTSNSRLSSDIITGIMPDENGTSLWVGTNGGGIDVIDLKTGAVEPMLSGDRKYSLTSNVIYSIYEDAAHRKWIGTLRGGINVIDPHKEKFTTLSHDPGDPHSLSSNFTYSFCEVPDGKVWIGLDGAGINIWDRKSSSFSSLRHIPGDGSSLSDNSVTRIKTDHLNNIWVATFSGGINRYNGSSHGFERYVCMDPVSGKENKVVFSLCEDSRNDLWAGTLRTADGVHGGLYRLSRKDDQFQVFDSNLSDLFLIQEDKLGNLWGGDLTRLILIDRDHRQHQYYEMGAPVRSVLEDRRGGFWVGTEGAGLVLFDRQTGKIKARFTTENGLCSNEVLNILEDNSGNLWISTFNGLSKFETAGGHFSNYYQSDGLQSNQFHYNASLRLSTGELMFGGIKGFTIFSPDRIAGDNGLPPLRITGVRVNNQWLQDQTGLVAQGEKNIPRTIKVPFSKSAFSFDFAALEYSAPGKIRYAYKMEGWDHDWTLAGAIRTATYTHLQEGTYTFRVRSTNTEGVWNDREQTLQIIVSPPWYRSWWAYTLYIMAAGSIVYFYWLYKSRQTRLQYEIKIAHINAEKEREMNEKEKELNQRRLSFFTNIAHEFRTPLTLIINPVKDLLRRRGASADDTEKEDLGIVLRNSTRLLSLVDQLLLFRKAESGLDEVHPVLLDFYTLCREVYLCFVQQAKIKDVQYDFECGQDAIGIMADREKVEIMLYNLLSNALKYVSFGGKVSLKVRSAEEEVEVRISNTGPGIPPEVGPRLFDKFYRGPAKNQATGFGIGLYLVKYFAEAHRGRVQYTSEPDKETIFTLTLPKEMMETAAGQPVGEVQPEVGGLSTGAGLSGGLKEEIALEEEAVAAPDAADTGLRPLVTDKQSMLVVDDDVPMRNYITKLFRNHFTVHEAGTADEGFSMVKKLSPDIIISDIQMDGMSGIEFCKKVKEEPGTSHIPVILLTGAASRELKIEGVENGADDYIVKPFEKELLTARVANLLQSRSNLQKYFFSEITLSQKDIYKVSEEDKQFLDKCMRVVEEHLIDDDFSIGVLAREMGMSHSAVYKKIKLMSGQSLASFIRMVRLRKAAELFINTTGNVNEVSMLVGMNDSKHFREQFNKVFGMNPSDYIKKFRRSFQEQYRVSKDPT